MASNYSKQQFAHLRVDLADGSRIQTGQFTLFDLIDRCFSFSTKRKQLAVQILTLLSDKPATFTALLAETGVPKSSLHLTLTALEQSGLIRQERRGHAFVLSGTFGTALEEYAGFWTNWKEKSKSG
ncbi:helix-turn-helix transcriptional regulator [Candidatus Micrarchaeota archaeon]|nr:helix-turn-helix transcriptional regulator [Candidatus Micrarchaeota archaeon]